MQKAERDAEQCNTFWVTLGLPVGGPSSNGEQRERELQVAELERLLRVATTSMNTAIVDHLEAFDTLVFFAEMI